MDDLEYNVLLNYIRQKSYPAEILSQTTEDARKAREYLRKKARNYSIIKRNGLDVLGIQYGGNSSVRVVVKKDEVEEVIKKAHEELGHPGVNATYEAIKRYLFWKCMSNDVRECVRRCESCQKSSQLKVLPSVLRPIAPPKRPFQIWGIDMTMLPESMDGFRFLIVAVDHLSKFVEAKPLKTKEASGVMLFFDELCARFGFPEAIITDQGREFCNTMMDTFCEQNQIDHRKTSAYHPQTNGLTERMNKTLKGSLRKLKATRTWPQQLPSVLRGIRSRVPRSTGHSAYELAYSFMPRVVSSGKEDNDDIEDIVDAYQRGDDVSEDMDCDAEESFMENAERQADRVVEARNRIIKDKENQKRAHDAKYNTATFKKGDVVKLQDTRRKTRKGENLGELFSGPYIIAAVTVRNTASLINKRTGDRVKKFVSFARLAPYYEKNNTGSEQMNEEGEMGGVIDDCELDFTRNGTEDTETDLDLRPPEIGTDFFPFSKETMDEISSKLGFKKRGTVLFGLSKQCSGPAAPSQTAQIAKDGNCLFRALSLSVSGTQENHTAIRKAVIQEMRSNSIRWSKVIGKPVEEYLSESKMERAKVYGTSTELLVFSELIERNVFVWTNYGSVCVPHYAWKILHLNCSSPRSQESVYLKLANCHYESVLSVE